MPDETREIKGEIEGWAKEPREFGSNGRGSRGIKVEGNWHNIIGAVTDLEQLEAAFEKGSFIRFKEKKNKKGYWDVDGMLIPITKKEAYENSIPEETIETGPRNPEATIEKPITQKRFQQHNKPEETVGLSRGETSKEILLQVAFKGAIEITARVISKMEGHIDFTEECGRVNDLTYTLYKGLNKSKEDLKKDKSW